MDGILDGFFDPFHLDSGTVRSLAHVDKVLGQLQFFALSLKVSNRLFESVNLFLNRRFSNERLISPPPNGPSSGAAGVRRKTSDKPKPVVCLLTFKKPPLPAVAYNDLLGS